VKRQFRVYVQSSTDRPGIACDAYLREKTKNGFDLDKALKTDGCGLYDGRISCADRLVQAISSIAVTN
jgi:hypothetical protein